MALSDDSIRITSIKVTGLFGLYDHHIMLKDERVTVIHGPNGVGKTVLLKLTNACLRGRYYEIAVVPFKVFEVFFDDQSSAQIVRESDDGALKKVSITFTDSKRQSDTATIEGEALNARHIAREISMRSPFLEQIGTDEWLDRRSGAQLSADEVIASVGEFSPHDAEKLQEREPKGLRQLRSRINVHLIETQRLIQLTTAYSSEVRYRPAQGRRTTATVQEYSDDLKRQLQTTLADYANQSQKLDQTFPQRLLKSAPTPLSLEQLKIEMTEVERTRQRLERIGILDRADAAQDTYPLPASQLDALGPSQIQVMSVYARDTKEKLSVLETLSDRIEIFLTVLNRKFINKTITISRESGIAIYGNDKKLIPVTALSSGEQHELVLLYDLLFKVKPNTLVLIDEPELSLHISWQKGFMDDLLEIIRIAKFDVVIATHSPYIVGDRSELLVVLSSDPVAQ